ncbi:MAG TPA: hypothetical protein VEK15_02340 [Vicinamibacteria bacterium]|nr:hypothetical protein [Vicinamibacteria bacterium]
MTKLGAVLAVSAFIACSEGVDAHARRYVELSLAWNEHDAGYVDAYFGPDLPAPKMTREAIREQAIGLSSALGETPGERGRNLRRLVDSLVGRIDVVEGRIVSFDDESMAVNGVVPPELETDIPVELDGTFERPVVSASAIDAVLAAALAECRTRTKRLIDLPDTENVRLELVHGEPWAAYHLYEGRYQSVVQFNLDFPLFVDRAIDEICHEAYPGHHVQQVLVERHLVEKRGFIEYSVRPLFGPMSFLAEGSANYALELLFPGDERMAFERDVLFPLAGLEPSAAPVCDRLRRRRKLLQPAIVDVARQNLDGELDLYSAILRLEKQGVVEPRASLEFAWRYRSQIAAYTYGESLVRRRLEKEPSPGRALERLWTTPVFPEEL